VWRSATKARRCACATIRDTPSTIQPVGTHQGRADRWAVQLLFAVIATLAIAPLFLYGNAGGHDSAFHFSSWVEATHQWRKALSIPDGRERRTIIWVNLASFFIRLFPRCSALH